MEYFQIRGAGPLRGETAVSGAKNAALPILAACVLCRGPCVLYNCPEIADVETTLAESIEPDRHLQPLQLVPQGQIFLRLFGLFAQRFDLKLEL